MSASSDRAIQQADADAERVGKRLGMVATPEMATRSALTQLLQETIVLRGEMRAIRLLLEEGQKMQMAGQSGDMGNAGPVSA